MGPVAVGEARGTVEGPPGVAGAGAVLRAIVGAGAGADGAGGAAGAPAVFKGMVGAGGAGAPADGAGGGVGAPPGAGSGLRVTRTVSFFKETAEVFFIGAGALGG